MTFLRCGVLAAAVLLAGSGPGFAQASMDGVYRAPSGGVAGNPGCGTTKFGYPVRVANGVVTLQTVSQGQLEGRVGQDGSVRIEHGPAVLVGRIAGNQFMGSYTVGRCSFALNYVKG
jgi:hypothetical protein